jgi:hypothetical protein
MLTLSGLEVGGGRDVVNREGLRVGGGARGCGGASQRERERERERERSAGLLERVSGSDLTTQDLHALNVFLSNPRTF